MELNILKIHIKTNLISGFIKPFKLTFGVLMLILLKVIKPLIACVIIDIVFYLIRSDRRII